MIPQFVISSDLRSLRDACDSPRRRGAFLAIREKIVPHLAHSKSDSYNPTTDYPGVPSSLLLELHCMASATFDALGDYELARQFVTPWTSDTEFPVTRLLGREDGEIGDDLTKNTALWRARAWLLQRCAVVEYRAGHHDHARGFLKLSLRLSEKLAALAPEDSSARDHNALIAMNCYWLGCVEIYANEFKEAETYLLRGLETLAEVTLGVDATTDYSSEAGEKLDPALDPARQLATYVSARLLLGLGLLHFFRGQITDSRSNLLMSAMLLQRYSADIRRLLRSQLLLLSVKRINCKSIPDLVKIHDQVEHLAQRFSEGGDACHRRYHFRAMWTLALVKADLSKLYQLTHTHNDSLRNDYLQQALQITTHYHSLAEESLTDQLELDILRIRILRKMGQTQQAMDWGNFVLHRASTRDQAFLYAETLLALAHAYYAHFQLTQDKAVLEKAQDLIRQANAEGNYRAQAIATLQQARIANQLGDKTQTHHLLERWSQIAQLVEYAWISEYADIVRREVETANRVVLKIESESDLYKQLHWQLRERLLTQFGKDRNGKDRNDTELAAKLGVSRQTLYAWRKEAKAGLPALGDTARRRGRPAKSTPPADPPPPESGQEPKA